MHEKQASGLSGSGLFFCAFLCLFVAINPGCKKRETDVERGTREQILHRGLAADLSGLDPHLETGLPVDAVGLKATTNEGSDDLGRGLAIAAHAVALIQKV